MRSLIWLVLLLSPSLWAAPTVQHWRTAQDVGVYFVPTPDLPMLDVRLVWAAGSARDADKPGLADVTAGMLGTGTPDLDATAIAARFEGLGARFGNGAERDMGWLHLRTLSQPEMQVPALTLLRSVLKEPVFREDELALVQSRMQTGIQARAQSIDAVAREAFNQAVFAGHPYGQVATAEDIAAITLEDVTRFYRTFYAAGNVTIALVGDLSRAEAEATAAALSAALPEGDAAPALPPVAPLTESQTLRVDFPSSQSAVLIGQPSISRDDPRRLPLYIANHSFGGNGFASILMDEVREQRGLVYSIYSYFAPMSQAGPFVIGFKTRNDQAQEALDLVFAELAEYDKSGPDAAQFESSVRNIVGGAPMNTDTNIELAQYLSAIGFYDMPVDYLETYIEKMQAVTLHEAREAFAEVIDPQKMVTVIVGQHEQE